MLTTPVSHNLSLEGEWNVTEGEDGADILHGLGRREAVGSRVALSVYGLEICHKMKISSNLFTAPP